MATNNTNFSNDATSVVEAIQNGVRTETIDVDGKEFVTRPVYLPPVKKDIFAIKVHSLEGLVEYLNKNVDGHEAKNLVIIISSHFSVSVYRQVEDAKEERTHWIVADYEIDGFSFGRFQDHEQFMIQAQALITETDARAELLKYLGNLTNSAVNTSTDDGISQTVVVEQGVRKSAIDLPNPVRLAPRRTFPEVNQPESPFVLRVRQQREGLMPEIALYESDGGLWKLKAIQNIKDYLNSALEVDIPVIG